MFWWKVGDCIDSNFQQKKNSTSEEGLEISKEAVDRLFKEC